MVESVIEPLRVVKAYHDAGKIPVGLEWVCVGLQRA